MALPSFFTRQTLVYGLLLLGILGSTAWIVQAPEPEHPKVKKLKLPAGFKAEHLYSPSEQKQGSWVAMTFDGKGRLITADQYGYLYRLEIPPLGVPDAKPKVEPLPIQLPDANVPDPVKTKVRMGYAQGLLWAFNSLYVMVNHESDKNFDKGSGLYRLQDTNGDDQFDKITLLKSLKGEGEHGPHSLVLAPDKQSIYVIAGNHTDVPEMNSYRLTQNWQEDNLLPTIKDPRGHAVDRMAPGGWIAHIDSLGSNWELVAAGFRNPFDLAFNEAGELFTYDSDMEWDFGLPWYRPTRICHVTSGAEFGWRTGNGKWLPAYPDNLPPVVNVGQGSPTNLIHGGSARFPEKYRNALFAFDWSFGIIYAVQLKPKGASYEAQLEEFISGPALPLTDGLIGPDGALYFLTGGRRLESDLYRVSYQGAVEEPKAVTASLTSEQQLRRQLEAFHEKAQPQAVDLAWPHLNHSDRFVRYAARLALEHQPVAQWQEKALQESDPQRSLQALLALTRQAPATLKSQVLEALAKIKFERLNEAQQVDWLRVHELVLLRLGTPTAPEKTRLLATLEPLYPARSAVLNRGLSKLLIALESPQAAPKTLALMRQKEEPGSQTLGGIAATSSSDLILRNPQYGLDIAKMLEKMPPAQQTFYAVMLSRQQTGWTPELRSQYFEWFAQAFQYQGGRSYIGFIDKARKMALSQVPKEQFDRYNKLSGEGLIGRSGNELASNYTLQGPGRNWKTSDALAVVDSGLNRRNFDRGKNIYSAILCSRCHTLRGEGGDIGPDLTQLGTRFSNKDILEAIIDPDKTVSDQYASTIFSLKNGKSLVGRLVNEDKTSYTISQNPFAPEQVQKIPKKNVTSTKYSSVSMMLPGLINGLNAEELKDLMAFLKSSGNPQHEVYQPKTAGGNE
ncbi:heme-binding protein [Siphonobacter sp. BAB-5405]|uniref:c-type cytochrome n=1 Tax=Siphonobacter sp. BAB-5405 TaxID=1864825 RepID=UPI000C805231|nr:c-type cytochrome [Siphonobacter sp. BAB-5405]PMD92375.1 heme-binding protein [Siphonobacter sp. BAB-5405]